MTTETIRDVCTLRDDTGTLYITWPNPKFIPIRHDFLSTYFVPDDVSAETYETLNTELVEHVFDSHGSTWSVGEILQSPRSGRVVLIEDIPALVSDSGATSGLKVVQGGYRRSIDFGDAQYTESEQVEQIWSRFRGMCTSYDELHRKVLTVQTSSPTVSNEHLAESLHAITLLFAEGFDDVKPSMTTLAKADRIVRAALETSGPSEIDVDDVSGALSFDLRLCDGRLLLAELEIDGGLTADLFDDRGEGVEWVTHFPNPSSRDLVDLL